MQTYDVVIAGGAIMGSASAWFLTQDPGFDGTVLVVEMDHSYQRCATALSVSAIRQQFSTAVNVQISRFGFEFLKGVQQRMEPDGGIGLVEQGYLMLAGPGREERLRDNVALQRREGADIALYGPGEMEQRWPWLNTEDVALGSFGLSGEGWFDPSRLLQYFRCGAVERGVTYIRGEVTGLEVRGKRVSRVRLADGQGFDCGHFVNATGSAAAGVARMAGIELEVEPRKRCVFVVDCPESARITDCPHLIDTSGLYLKPSGQYFLAGKAPPPGADARSHDFEVDYAMFEEQVWPLLAGRVPAFEAARVVSAWAGHYAYHLLDQNAVIGPHPEISNFLFINGFSGHGMQQAPAAGRAISEFVRHGRCVSLDLSELGYERVAAGRPFPELNVI
jgi:glycine/D-amino acid oxidase-like deaminating enzyme